MGCAPDWSGTFVGTLSSTGFCSDGSSVPPSSDAVQVTLTDDGDTVTWESNCGATFIADINDDDQANVRQTSCPATTNADGVTSSFTVEDGTLTLNNNTLQMEINFIVTVSGTISGTMSGTCSVTSNGTLKRLEEQRQIPRSSAFSRSPS